MNCCTITRATLAIVALCVGGSSSIAKKANKQPDAEIAVEITEAPRFPALGFAAQCVSNLDSEKGACTLDALDPKDRLTVLFVEEDSLANEAGLAAGDIVISVAGIYLSKGKTAIARLEEEVIPTLDESDTVAFLVIRDGYTRELTAPANTS